MVSYAQNAEDVVLQRVFEGIERGFYVDVGASDPVEDSVTLHFYREGWSGVNIEPDPSDYEQLCEKRKRDVNLNAAVDISDGEVMFYPSETRGHGTLDSRVGETRDEISSIRVPSIPLERIFAEHVPAGDVDFLKVDVEGWEQHVLASTAWRSVRPRIIVVEAVDPYGNATYENWESMLLTASYRFGLFDGVNRFYCREEDADDLLPRLGAPANVLDNWRPAREVLNQAALEARLAETEAARLATGTELEAERTALETERTAHAKTRATLAGVLDSRSWRITAPLRDLDRLMKVMRRGSAP
jgi:FkbM family methyltransferase